MKGLRYHLLRRIATKLGYGNKENNRDLRFKKRIAPSRHSGLSSLSPKEPSSSLTIISAGSGTRTDRMSPNSRWTFSFHSEAFRCCRLSDSVTGARRPDQLGNVHDKLTLYRRWGSSRWHRRKRYTGHAQLRPSIVQREGLSQLPPRR